MTSRQVFDFYGTKKGAVEDARSGSEVGGFTFPELRGLEDENGAWREAAEAATSEGIGWGDNPPVCVPREPPGPARESLGDFLGPGTQGGMTRESQLGPVPTPSQAPFSRPSSHSVPSVSPSPPLPAGLFTAPTFPGGRASAQRTL